MLPSIFKLKNEYQNTLGNKEPRVFKFRFGGD